MAMTMKDPVEEKEVELKSTKMKKEKTRSEAKEETRGERVNRWWRGGV